MKRQTSLKIILCFVSFNFLSLGSALALGKHCLIKPDQIGMVAQRIFRANQAAGEYFPEESIVQNRAESQVSFKNGNFTTQRDVNFEGFYRPSESTWFSILPIPIFVAQLDRDRNVVYICAHNEEDAAKSYVIIYFLKGYKISKTTYATFIGDALFSSIDVASINLMPVGTIPFKNFFDRVDKIIPFASLVSAPISALGYLQNVAVGVLGQFVGVGVQRIIVTNDHVILESGIDMKNPDKARFSRKISLTGAAE